MSPTNHVRLEFLALAGLVYVTGVAIARHLGSSPIIAVGILADLTISVPLLAYIILVRRGAAPGTLPVLLSAFGMTAGIHLIPDPLLGPFADARHAVWLALRLLVPAFVGTRLLSALLSLRDPAAGPQPLTAFRRLAGSQRLAHLLLQEWHVLRLAILGWFQPVGAAGQIFTQHKTSNLAALVITFAVLLPLETACMHLVLAHWNSTAAWVTTGTSFYALVWLSAFYQSLRLGPTVLNGRHLSIGAGLRGRVNVDLDQIAGLEAITRADRRQPDYLHAASLVSPNLLLTLARPAIAVDIGGRERLVTRVGLYLDDPAGFRRAVTERTDA